MPPAYSDQSPALRRPGKVVTTLMCVMGGLWLAFAVGTHWAGVGPDVFDLFSGSTLGVLRGQAWRLITAPLLHDPDGFWHLFTVLLSLFFFAAPLEADWGRKRFLRFLFGLALIPSLVQAVFDVALPLEVRSGLVGPYWYGGGAIANGMAVAWALNNRSEVIRFYGLFPVSARTLIWIVVGYPLLYLIFRSAPREGIPALFAGSFAGWLLGGGTPSPLRRYWLKFRINRLDAEVAREAAQRKKRVERSRLKVVEGGLGKPDPTRDGEKGRGPDGRWLN